jgi:GTP cyclohydrolase FolE2
MFSYRSLVLGLTSKHYQITSLKTMRCQFSLPAEKAGAISSQSGSALQDMKDEYGDMDCSGETFIAKNFELESGHVLSEAHVRFLLPMFRSHHSSQQKLQECLIIATTF